MKDFIRNTYTHSSLPLSFHKLKEALTKNVKRDNKVRTVGGAFFT